MPKNVADMATDVAIEKKFIKDDTVRIILTQLKIKVRNKKKIVIDALIDEQR